MRITLNRLAFIVLSMAFSFNAHATLDFMYILNTSDWDFHTNLTDGDTLTFNFNDGTDLNNIASSDIFAYTYNFAAGTSGTAFYDGGWAADVGDIGSAFSWDGTELHITYDLLCCGDFIQAADDQGYFSQVVTGQADHVFGEHSGGSSSAGLSSGSLTLSSRLAEAVPEPSIIALFGLGLLGLGFARRRKAQS